MEDASIIGKQEIVSFENLHANISSDGSRGDADGDCSIRNGSAVGDLSTPDGAVLELPNVEQNMVTGSAKIDDTFYQSNAKGLKLGPDANKGAEEKNENTDLTEEEKSSKKNDVCDESTPIETSASVLKTVYNEDDVVENLAKSESGLVGDKEDVPIEEIARGIVTSIVDGATGQILNENMQTDDERCSSTESDKKDEWLDILGNGLLRKRILQSGEGPDSRPMRENEVSIKYEARLKTGNKIVESNDNLSFVLAEQDVLAVFDLAVALMQKGEVAIVESDARYAYGDEGNPPNIPPSTDLVFEIALLGVSDGPFSEKVDLEKRLTWADKKRQKGNEFYSAKKYAEAASTYTRAIKSLESGWMYESSTNARSRINGMRLKCYNNLTATQMKLEKWKESLQTCRAAEKLDPSNVKTLFRKGRIHCELGEVEKGVSAFSKAAKLEPDNKSVANELGKQTWKLEKQKEAQKKMYRRMLGTKSDAPPTMKLLEDVQQRSWLRNWGRVMGGTLAIGAVLVGMYIAHRG